MDPYPKPSAMGGTLIRKVISLFKEESFALPLEGKILIAVSGGVDSMVLAHLITKYGRKIVDPSQITLLHFDHGWRPESATIEREGVKKLAENLGVGFLPKDLERSQESLKSTNLEADARLKRNAVYAELTAAGQPYALVLTAHHQDDVAETLFWRFFRGELFEFTKGILFQDSSVLRLLLKVTKEEIRAYATQEGVSFFEDPTNSDPDPFRSWMRTEVLPLIESHFPQVRKVVAEYANQKPKVSEADASIQAIEMVTGNSLNRAQREVIQRMIQDMTIGSCLTLPGRMQVKRLKSSFLIENLDQDDSLK